MAEQKNEGEGNRTAAKAYDKAATEFAKSGRVEKGAEAARKAVENDPSGSLEAAEKAGKSRAKGEDPQLYKSK